MIKIVDPTRIFVNNRAGAVEVVKLQSSYITVGAGDVSVIAAVADKRHRILGWHLSAGAAAATSYVFYNGASAGGLTLFGITMPLGTVDFAPIAESGYFECSTNTALIVVRTGANGVVNVFYTTYTP